MSAHSQRRAGEHPAASAASEDETRWKRLLRLALPLFLTVPAAASAADRPAEITDRRAIMALLDTYSAAVTRKDRATFETLLLGKDTPFSFVPANPSSAGAIAWRNYDDLRRGVFEGPSFTQRFRDVAIRQHDALADVDLVYVNQDAQGVHPGWKTMQLLKVGGRWKIASEFFTDLKQPPGRAAPSVTEPASCDRQGEETR